VTQLHDLLPDEYRRLPQISRQAVQLLWSIDFWDGPLSGILLHNDRPYMFIAVRDYIKDDVRDGEARHHLIVELSPEQVQEEEIRQRLFEAQVDTHMTYPTGVQQAEIGHVQPSEIAADYYRVYPPSSSQLDVGPNVVIGWFANTHEEDAPKEG